MSLKAEVGSEISEKVVYVGRCAKVVKGGRRFSFLVLVVVGDEKGRVGIGSGKAPEVVDARSKAIRIAKKNMVKIPLREARTIHHDAEGRFCAAKVVIRSAPAGTGLIAGGPVRALLEVLGVQDVVAKSVRGNNNAHNMLKAALDALNNSRSARYIAEKRGMKIGEIAVRRGELSTSGL